MYSPWLDIQLSFKAMLTFFATLEITGSNMVSFSIKIFLRFLNLRNYLYQYT